MATIYVRKRRKLTRTDCIFLGVVTVFIAAMLTFAAVSAFLKGEINIAGPIVMPLISISWPIFFFSKANSLREAEDKKHAEFLAKKAAEAEKQKKEQQAKLAQQKLSPEQQKERLCAQKDAQVLIAYLQATRTLSKVPIVVSSPAGEYTATEDFVISWFEGKVCCSPAEQAQGLLLGKFVFRDKIWHYTNMAPANVKTELGSRPPMAPGETRNIVPMPIELLYHTADNINGITAISAGWK